MKRTLTGLALIASATAVGVGASSSASLASSHREAPMITEDPTVDCTDVYAFVSPDATDTVTIIANYIPLEEPSGGPNYFKFSDTALYEVHIDNTGDAVEDVTYQLRFTTTIKNGNTFLYNTGPITAGNGTYDGLNVEQRYEVTKVTGDRRRGQATVVGAGILVAPTNVGPKSISNYASLANLALATLSDGAKVFCGPRDDPFFICLGRAFDLVNVDPVLPGGRDNQSIPANDHLAGFNCHTIALQVPKTALTRTGAAPTDAANPDSIIGVWSTASRKQVRLQRLKGKPAIDGGAWVQVSRLGMPLVNELVIPLAQKDVWNNSHPRDDAQFLSYVQDPEPARALSALFGPNGLNPVGLQVPAAPRQDFVQVFLTGVPGLNEKGVPCEYLRLNMAIAPTPVGQRNRLGVLAGQLDGFPNGRRLEDDVVDIALRVSAGVLVQGFDMSPNNELGDTVISNDEPFLTTFPYVAPPHDGVTRGHNP